MPPRKKSPLTRKRTAIALGVVWLIILVYAGVAPITPVKSDSPYPDMAVFPPKCPSNNHLCTESTIPHTSATIWSTFTAEGGVFAATNPIYITLKLDVNRSNFLQYYRGISFFGADYLNGTSQGVLLPLSRVDNYTYQASGALEWATADPVYWFLVPQPQYFTTFLLGPHSNTTGILLNVTGAQDTISMRASDSATRLMIAGLGSGVVGVFGLATAFLPEVRKLRSKR